MEAPPSDPKRISLLTLLFPLLSMLLVVGLMGWQTRAAQQPIEIPELTAAANALQAKNIERARQQFDQALNKTADQPMVYRAVMAECSALGRYDLACEYGERAIQVCRYVPNSVRAELYETLAGCYADGHEPRPQQRAVEYARRALELAPEDASALNSLGYILAENVQTEAEANIALGYVNHALNLLREQVTSAPGMLAQTEDSYGWALYKRGRFHAEDYAHATDALRQAIEDMPQDFPGTAQKVVYYHLGAACRAAGQIEEARHALQIALLYDPQYAEAKDALNLLPAQSPPLPSNGVPTTSAAPSAAAIAHNPAVPVQTPDGKPIFKPLHDNNLQK